MMASSLRVMLLVLVRRLGILRMRILCLVRSLALLLRHYTTVFLPRDSLQVHIPSNPRDGDGRPYADEDERSTPA